MWKIIVLCISGNLGGKNALNRNLLSRFHSSKQQAHMHGMHSYDIQYTSEAKDKIQWACYVLFPLHDTKKFQNNQHGNVIFPTTQINTVYIE
jgi:hypothetical protein